MRNTFTGKICLVLFSVLSLMCSARILIAQGTALNANEGIFGKEIYFEVNNIPLDKALKKLESITQIKFVYSSNQIDLKQKVTLSAKPMQYGEVLNRLLSPLNIGFQLNETGEFIMLTILKPKEVGLNNEGIGKSEVLISGKVTDSENTPLPGVNIIIQGTTTGTTTDGLGNYSIEAELHDVLIFSFIGFASQMIEVTSESIINIKLLENITSLDNVVIIGYGTTTKKLNTGNVSRIESADIQRQPVNNPLKALQGMVPGVFIKQETGVPGGNFNVLIRGTNSLRANANKPLYIIDGVPFNASSLSSPMAGGGIVPNASPLNYINPADIESIDILKDADATAIYGSRGANGVILITTKKGKIGKTQFEATGYTGWGEVTRTLPLLNTDQYLEMRKEAYENDGFFPEDDGGWDLYQWDQNRYTDWQQTLIGNTARLSNLQLSLSGGNEQTQVLVKGGFYSESTVFPGELANKKGSAHVQINHADRSGKFRLNLTTTYLKDHNRLLPTDYTNMAISLPPNAPELYLPNGDLNWEGSTWVNPMAELKRKYESNTNNLLTNLILSYDILPELTARLSSGYTTTSVDEISTTPASYYDPAFAAYVQSMAIFADAEIESWIMEPQLEWKKRLGKVHFSSLMGATFQQNVQQGTTSLATGFPNEALIENIMAASNVSITSNQYTEYRYNAFFGRVNINWNEKYLFNLTGRRDGSSRFGPSNRFANFGAIGVGWIFSNENALRNKGSILSFGKLRGSYGVTGNDQIPDYGYMDTYVPSPYPYNGGTGLLPTRLVNPDYGWETNKKLEAALELGFWEDNLLLSTSWYFNRSSNQLIGYPLPLITGQSSIQANFPATLENTGWEIDISANILKRSEFSWTAGFNITFPYTELAEFPGIENTSYVNQYKVGESLNLTPKFHMSGVDSETGTYVFQDVDGNGNGTDYPADLQFLRELGQKFYGGIRTTLTYKGWELDIQGQFVDQTGMSYIGMFYNPPGTMSNQPTWVMDRWQTPGDITNVQRFTSSSFLTAAGEAYLGVLNAGDNVIQDASYFRLKNVFLSWRLPQSWQEKLSLEGAKIFLQAQNLLTITNYQGLDPENPGFAVLPPLRVITLGAQLIF